jgi:hypothetical protein
VHTFEIGVFNSLDIDDFPFTAEMETSEFIALAKGLSFNEENPLSGQKLEEYIEDNYVKNGEIIRKAKIGE